MSIAKIMISGSPVVFIHIPKTGGTSIREGRQAGSTRLFGIPDEWREIPSFAFVRDPLDRAESAWRDFRFLRGQTGVSFPAFLEQAAGASEEKIADPTTVEHHSAPMTHPVHGLQHSCFVGRYSNLREDLDRFCDLYDIPRVTPLPRLRKAPDDIGTLAPRNKYIKDLAREIYQADYEFMDAIQ